MDETFVCFSVDLCFLCVPLAFVPVSVVLVRVLSFPSCVRVFHLRRPMGSAVSTLAMRAQSWSLVFADVDHGVEEPSACSTLKSLNKVAPVGQKAAVPERLMASKVAEGLEERSPRQLRPAADHEQTSCGDPGHCCTRHWLHRGAVAVQMLRSHWTGVVSGRSFLMWLALMAGVAWTRFGVIERKFIKAIEAKLEE